MNRIGVTSFEIVGVDTAGDKRSRENKVQFDKKNFVEPHFFLFAKCVDKFFCLFDKKFIPSWDKRINEEFSIIEKL